MEYWNQVLTSHTSHPRQVESQPFDFERNLVRKPLAAGPKASSLLLQEKVNPRRECWFPVGQESTTVELPTKLASLGHFVAGVSAVHIPAILSVEEN